MVLNYRSTLNMAPGPLVDADGAWIPCAKGKLGDTAGGLRDT